MPEPPSQPQRFAVDKDVDPKTFTFLANIMAQDESMTILRRFDELNILNLLVLQDEIQGLDESLKELCRSIEYYPDGFAPNSQYLASYVSNYRPKKNDEQESEAMRHRAVKWKSLREKLREYNSCILEMAQLRNLEPPTPADIARLRQELQDLTAISKLPPIPDKCWDPEYEDDLTAIRADARKSSRLNIWAKLIMSLIKWELWAWKKEETVRDDPRNIVFGVKKPHMSKLEMAKKHAFTSRLLMALFGGVSLIIPTILMAKLPGINYSLIITSVSVSVFALVLAFGATDSTGKDVLGMTAAYTAVLVVFVGTSLAEGGAAAAAIAQSNSTSV